MFRAGFNARDGLKDVAGSNMAFDGHAGDKDLAFRNEDLQISPVAQPLTDDTHQAIRQLGAHVILNFRRKRGDESLQGFHAGGGMNGGENQVPGFRRVERQPHHLGLAHFANHEDIGVFTERIDDGLFKGRCVAAHLALANEGSSGPERIFDGAFNRHDVAGFVQVDLLYQGGHGG